MEGVFLMSRGRKIVKTIELEECLLKVAAEEFYRHNRVKGLAEETQKAYKGYVESFIEWCGKDLYVTDVTVKMLDEYVYKKEADGNKRVSIATNMVHLRRFFNFCVSRGYMEKIEVTIPKFEKELKDPYTDVEMEKLLKKPITNNWVEYRNWVMVNYFFSTGQRLSTVLNIRIKDLDLNKSRVKLVWNKDKIQKYMPLSTALVRILKEYIDLSALEYEDYLFPEYEGKKLKNRSAEDSIAEYNRTRGVQKTSIHLFRHTFAKNYIVNGGNPVKLQKLLNHKTMDVTMKYVNIYGNDIAGDLDLYNPLDCFKRRHYTPTKRKNIACI